jgi:hypothetical protein
LRGFDVISGINEIYSVRIVNLFIALLEFCYQHPVNGDVPIAIRDGCNNHCAAAFADFGAMILVHTQSSPEDNRRSK